MSPEQAQGLLDALIQIVAGGIVAVLIVFGMLVVAVRPKRNGK